MNYYSRELGNDATLRLAPLSNADAVAAGLGYENLSGYVLSRTRRSEAHSIEILAQVPSDDAAFQLSLLLRLE